MASRQSSGQDLKAIATVASPLVRDGSSVTAIVLQ